MKSLKAIFRRQKDQGSGGSQGEDLSRASSISNLHAESATKGGRGGALAKVRKSVSKDKLNDNVNAQEKRPSSDKKGCNKNNNQLDTGEHEELQQKLESMANEKANLMLQLGDHKGQLSNLQKEIARLKMFQEQSSMQMEQLSDENAALRNKLRDVVHSPLSDNEKQMILLDSQRHHSSAPASIAANLLNDGGGGDVTTCSTPDWDKQSSSNVSEVSVACLQDKINQMQETHYSTNEELQATLQELTDLQRQLTELQQDNEHLLEEKNLMFESLCRQTERLSDARNEIESLKKLLYRDKDESGHDESAAEREQKLVDLLKNAQAEREMLLVKQEQLNNEIQEARTAFGQRENENLNLTERVRTLESTLDAKHAEHKQLDQDLARAKDKSSSRQIEIDRLTDLLENARTKIVELEQDRALSDKSELDELLDNARKEKDALESEVANLKEQLARGRNEGEKLREQVSILQEECKVLRNNAKCTQSELEYKVEVLTAEKNGLLEQLQGLEEAANELQVQAQCQLEDKRQLSSVLSETQRNMSEVEKKNKELEVELKDIKKIRAEENEEWEKFQNDLLTSVRVANDFKNEAQQELQNLVLENKAHRDKIRQLEAQIEKLKESVGTAVADVEALRRRIVVEMVDKGIDGGDLSIVKVGETGGHGSEVGDGKDINVLEKNVDDKEVDSIKANSFDSRFDDKRVNFGKAIFKSKSVDNKSDIEIMVTDSVDTLEITNGNKMDKEKQVQVNESDIQSKSEVINSDNNNEDIISSRIIFEDSSEISSVKDETKLKNLTKREAYYLKFIDEEYAKIDPSISVENLLPDQQLIVKLKRGYDRHFAMRKAQPLSRKKEVAISKPLLASVYDNPKLKEIAENDDVPDLDSIAASNVEIYSNLGKSKSKSLSDLITEDTVDRDVLKRAFVSQHHLNRDSNMSEYQDSVLWEYSDDDDIDDNTRRHENTPYPDLQELYEKIDKSKPENQLSKEELYVIKLKSSLDGLGRKNTLRRRKLGKNKLSISSPVLESVMSNEKLACILENPAITIAHEERTSWRDKLRLRKQNERTSPNTIYTNRKLGEDVIYRYSLNSCAIKIETTSDEDTISGSTNSLEYGSHVVNTFSTFGKNANNSGRSVRSEDTSMLRPHEDNHLPRRGKSASLTDIQFNFSESEQQGFHEVKPHKDRDKSHHLNEENIHSNPNYPQNFNNNKFAISVPDFGKLDSNGEETKCFDSKSEANNLNNKRNPNYNRKSLPNININVDESIEKIEANCMFSKSKNTTKVNNGEIVQKSTVDKNFEEKLDHKLNEKTIDKSQNSEGNEENSPKSNIIYNLSEVEYDEINDYKEHSEAYKKYCQYVQQNIEANRTPKNVEAILKRNRSFENRFKHSDENKIRNSEANKKQVRPMELNKGLVMSYVRNFESNQINEAKPERSVKNESIERNKPEDYDKAVQNHEVPHIETEANIGEGQNNNSNENSALIEENFKQCIKSETNDRYDVNNRTKRSITSEASISKNEDLEESFVEDIFDKIEKPKKFEGRFGKVLNDFNPENILTQNEDNDATSKSPGFEFEEVTELTSPSSPNDPQFQSFHKNNHDIINTAAENEDNDEPQKIQLDQAQSLNIDQFPKNVEPQLTIVNTNVDEEEQPYSFIFTEQPQCEDKENEEYYSVVQKYKMVMRSLRRKYGFCQELEDNETSVDLNKSQVILDDSEEKLNNSFEEHNNVHFEVDEIIPSKTNENQINVEDDNEAKLLTPKPKPRHLFNARKSSIDNSESSSTQNSQQLSCNQSKSSGTPKVKPRDNKYITSESLNDNLISSNQKIDYKSSPPEEELKSSSDLKKKIEVTSTELLTEDNNKPSIRSKLQRNKHLYVNTMTSPQRRNSKSEDIKSKLRNSVIVEENDSNSMTESTSTNTILETILRNNIYSDMKINEVTTPEDIDANNFTKTSATVAITEVTLAESVDQSNDDYTVAFEDSGSDIEDEKSKQFEDNLSESTENNNASKMVETDELDAENEDLQSNATEVIIEEIDAEAEANLVLRQLTQNFLLIEQIMSECYVKSLTKVPGKSTKSETASSLSSKPPRIISSALKTSNRNPEIVVTPDDDTIENVFINENKEDNTHNCEGNRFILTDEFNNPYEGNNIYSNVEEKSNNEAKCIDEMKVVNEAKTEANEEKSEVYNIKTLGSEVNVDENKPYVVKELNSSSESNEDNVEVKNDANKFVVSESDKIKILRDENKSKHEVRKEIETDRDVDKIKSAQTRRDWINQSLASNLRNKKVIDETKIEPLTFKTEMRINSLRSRRDLNDGSSKGSSVLKSVEVTGDLKDSPTVLKNIEGTGDFKDSPLVLNNIEGTGDFKDSPSVLKNIEGTGDLKDSQVRRISKNIEDNNFQKYDFAANKNEEKNPARRISIEGTYFRKENPAANKNEENPVRRISKNIEDTYFHKQGFVANKNERISKNVPNQGHVADEEKNPVRRISKNIEETYIRKHDNKNEENPVKRISKNIEETFLRNVETGKNAADVLRKTREANQVKELRNVSVKSVRDMIEANSKTSDVAAGPRTQTTNRSFRSKWREDGDYEKGYPLARSRRINEGLSKGKRAVDEGKSVDGGIRNLGSSEVEDVISIRNKYEGKIEEKAVDAPIKANLLKKEETEIFGQGVEAKDAAESILMIQTKPEDGVSKSNQCSPTGLQSVEVKKVSSIGGVDKYDFANDDFDRMFSES